MNFTRFIRGSKGPTPISIDQHSIRSSFAVQMNSKSRNSIKMYSSHSLPGIRHCPYHPDSYSDCYRGHIRRNSPLYFVRDWKCITDAPPLCIWLFYAINFRILLQMESKRIQFVWHWCYRWNSSSRIAESDLNDILVKIPNGIKECVIRLDRLMRAGVWSDVNNVKHEIMIFYDKNDKSLYMYTQPISRWINSVFLRTIYFIN